MRSIEKFEGIGLQIYQGNKVLTRSDVGELYGVARKTLSDNINKLKEDGHISGAEIRHTASDGKSYLMEVYNVREILAIGMRLRTDRAIVVQNWLLDLGEKELDKMKEENEALRISSNTAWRMLDKEDVKDLYIN